MTATVLLFILTASNRQNQRQDTFAPVATSNEKYAAIEGNWELVSTEMNGKQTTSKRFPQHFNMFHDGFFLW